LTYQIQVDDYTLTGEITSPRDGEKDLFLSGETAKIKWEIDDLISAVQFRIWSYKSSEGATAHRLARIFDDGSTDRGTKLFNFTIERPSTLVLNNVNQSYNGIYQFAYTASATFISEVVVSIASKLSINIEFSSLRMQPGIHTIVNELSHLIIHCLNCIRRDGNSTSKTGRKRAPTVEPGIVSMIKG
jgi:hypothetical protein